ncbi:hypothetical protein MBLNU457_g0919t1 [Dothideomycetes sp. NU457]
MAGSHSRERVSRRLEESTTEHGRVSESAAKAESERARSSAISLSSKPATAATAERVSEANTSDSVSSAYKRKRQHAYSPSRRSPSLPRKSRTLIRQDASTEILVTTTSPKARRTTTIVVALLLVHITIIDPHLHVLDIAKKRPVTQEVAVEKGMTQDGRG